MVGISVGWGGAGPSLRKSLSLSRREGEPRAGCVPGPLHPVRGLRVSSTGIPRSL